MLLQCRTKGAGAALREILEETYLDMVVGAYSVESGNLSESAVT